MNLNAMHYAARTNLAALPLLIFDGAASRLTLSFDFLSAMANQSKSRRIHMANPKDKDSNALSDVRLTALQKISNGSDNINFLHMNKASKLLVILSYQRRRAAAATNNSSSETT